MSIKNKQVAFLRNKFYPPDKYIDHDTIFYNWINESLTKDQKVLDIAAGDGNIWKYDFKERCKEVIGIDVDKKILSNPNLTTAVLGNFFENSFKDSSFDIVFANYFVEHINDPVVFLKEIQRILKTGGSVYFRTLNLYYYAGIVSKFTPFAFHRYYNKKLDRVEHDIWPTFYRLNTTRKIKKLSKKLGLHYEIKMFEGYPGYLRINPILFLMGVLYERTVNKINVLNDFKGILMCKLTFYK